MYSYLNETQLISHPLVLRKILGQHATDIDSGLPAQDVDRQHAMVLSGVIAGLLPVHQETQSRSHEDAEPRALIRSAQEQIQGQRDLSRVFVSNGQMDTVRRICSDPSARAQLIFVFHSRCFAQRKVLAFLQCFNCPLDIDHFNDDGLASLSHQSLLFCRRRFICPNTYVICGLVLAVMLCTVCAT